MQVVADLFLADGICDQSGFPEEVKILADRTGLGATAKGIIVEGILVIIEAIT